jgi:hypothetical protein
MKLEKFNRRRNFIKKTGLALASLTITPGLSLGSEGINLILQQGPDSQSNNPEGLKTVAFICNIYFSISHADSIGTKLFLGSPMDQGRGIVPPKIKIVSMYIAQIGSNDIGVQMAKKNGVTLYPTIADALTLGGDK